jgi:hypothetical protein
MLGPVRHPLQFAMRYLRLKRRIPTSGYDDRPLIGCNVECTGFEFVCAHAHGRGIRSYFHEELMKYPLKIPVAHVILPEEACRASVISLWAGFQCESIPWLCQSRANCQCSARASASASAQCFVPSVCLSNVCRFSNNPLLSTFEPRQNERGCPIEPTTNVPDSDL